MKISPAHGGHVFCRIKISSRNLKEVHPRNIHTKLQWNPLSHYGEEDFLSFTICYIVKISPTHGGHVFCRINFFSRNLQEGNPRNNHTKLQWNPLSHYGEEDFLKFHYMSYSENKPRPRRPCFLSDQNLFKESERGPPKEHSYQIIMKSIEPLWRRRFFKVSLYAI